MGTQFYHPEVGSLKDPYGFPLWSLSNLYLPSNFFLISKSQCYRGLFWTPKFFNVTDGWDGMYGWSGNFFFELISRKLLNILSNLFRILLECLTRYFLRKTQKIQKKSDFSKIFAKIGGWFFFRFFEHKFANFSKTTCYFFLIVFGPLRRDFKTASAKKSKK